jgi:hypothetical protein
MSKTINPYDIFELAKSTGRSPAEILQVVEQEGWQIDDTAPSKVQHLTETKQGSVMNNPNGAVEMMRSLREETVNRLYKSDPLVRESMNARAAIDAAKASKPKESNLIHDEQGRLIGVKHSVVSGVHATGNNQVALMREIKENINKQYGVTQ